MNRADEARLAKAILPIGMQMGDVMQLASGAEHPDEYLILGEEIAQALVKFAKRVEAPTLERVLRDRMGSIIARAQARQDPLAAFQVPARKIIAPS